MKPEDLLHLFGPYLPTDRFRALLANKQIPIESHGAALMVDISGFTPLTTQLVTEFGAQRASEELKRRLNPMFEAIAGQVFHHGGSVIRFTGDGFIAWFDDSPVGQTDDATPDVSGLLRSIAAGAGMQGVMPLFRGLKLKVCIGEGEVHRWVVGLPEYGLVDILSGPAVVSMLSLSREVQPEQVLVSDEVIPRLRDAGVEMQIIETGSVIVLNIPDTLARSTRQHRWPAWSIEGDANEILNAVRPYVASAIRQQVESGFGDFVGELRSSSPMFIQVSGLDAGGLDPYIRSVQGVLANYGGRLVSVEVGDKGSVIFAVFGAPIAYGDDTERAVSAAITLRDMATATTHLSLRIGVSRGLLFAGTIGGEVRHEYSTIGDETNVAARLMSSAKGGQILISSMVKDEIGPRITFNELPPVNVKGKSIPIPVFEPITFQAGSNRRVHVGEFVGRTAELDQMRRALKAVAQGMPRLLRIEGQAGIGKSRLIAEFTRIATEPGRNFRTVMGDCLSLGRTMAYLPWREVLVSLLDLNLDLPLDENAAALTSLISDIEPDWVARLPLLGDLLQLAIPDTAMTVKLEARMRRQALAALVIDLILYYARQQPLVIVIEDTQWIDEVSEQLAIDLARRLVIESVPLFLIFIHRPLLDADHSPHLIDAISELHITTHMLLDELSRADVNSMIEKYLDATIPPELSRFVYDRAQGNPFFVQEVIDTLLETGYVRPVGSRVFIEKDLATADLPQTVQGLVQARIDRLSEIDKLVLKVAAVIGRQFQVKVLAESIPIPMGYNELLDRLHILEERDFSHQEVPEPDLTYLFKHAITQEVTYQSLLFAQRRQLHLAVAQTLEVLVPEATERLAYHYARSGESERAKNYLILAGQKAFREYANQSAMGYFTQAVEIASNDEEKFDFNRQRIGVMLRQGDAQGVQTELPAMQQLATQYNRPDWQAIVHLIWAHYHTQTSAWAQAAEEAQKAIALAEELSDDVLAWDAFIMLRNTYMRMNRRDAAEELSKPMSKIAERSDDPRRSIELVLLEIENLYAEVPMMAVRGAQAVLADAQELKDPVIEADCWSTLATLYQRENDLPAALDASRQEINLLRQIGDRRREGLTLNQIGIVLIKLGQLSEGNHHLLDAYKILHQIGERAGEATSLVYLGVIAYHYKAYDESLAYMRRGLALQRTLNAGADAALTLFYMGNAYIRKFEFDEAAKSLAEARGLLLTNDQAQHVNEIDMALAEIDLLRGQLTSARYQITPLLLRLTGREVSDLFLPGLAYWRAIEVLEKLGETDQADELRTAFQEEAATVLDKLTDRGWRTSYIEAIWFHAALLDNAEP